MLYFWPVPFLALMLLSWLGWQQHFRHQPLARIRFSTRWFGILFTAVGLALGLGNQQYGSMAAFGAVGAVLLLDYFGHQRRGGLPLTHDLRFWHLQGWLLLANGAFGWAAAAWAGATGPRPWLTGLQAGPVWLEWLLLGFALASVALLGRRPRNTAVA